MLDIVLIITGFVLVFAGLVGAFVPVLPGPPLSYAGLVAIHFTEKASFSFNTLIIIGLLAIFVTVADYILPVIGTNRSGGSRHGVLGASVGLVIGVFFFPPFGIIICPILGAFLAEIVNGKASNIAFKSAIGSFAGLLIGLVLKLILSAYIAWIIFKEVIIVNDVV